MQTICTSLQTEAIVRPLTHTHTRARARAFDGPLSGTTRVNRYQKGKTNLDFTEARDSEWQCHQLGHMQVCTSLQTDNHASNPSLSFLQAGCPSCRPTNSVKALKAYLETFKYKKIGVRYLTPAIGSSGLNIRPIGPQMKDGKSLDSLALLIRQLVHSKLHVHQSSMYMVSRWPPVSL